MPTVFYVISQIDISYYLPGLIIIYISLIFILNLFGLYASRQSSEILPLAIVCEILTAVTHCQVLHFVYDNSILWSLFAPAHRE